MKRIITTILTTIIILAGFSPIFAFADGKEEGNKSFSVEPLIPTEQADKTLSYFNLVLQPNQESVIEVKVSNHSEDEITVLAETNTAFTNNNGITQYSASERKPDSTLIHSFSEIGRLEENEIKLAGNESRNIKISLKMPDEKFDGHILGGIYFSLKNDSTEEQKKQIANTYSYTIGVLLSNTGEEIASNLVLSEVRAEQKNFRNVILANIQNTEAAMIRELKLDGKIYPEKGSEVLYQAQTENLRMAPNSNFDYSIPLGNKRFQSGSYRLEMTAVADGKEYKWVEKFKITSDEAKRFNETAVELEKPNNLIYYIIIGGTILAILIVIVVIQGRRLSKKNQPESNKLKNSSKKKKRKKK